MNKKKQAYKTIGETAKYVGLFNNKTGHASTHTIRFWEKQFKQIKPRIFAGKRRYYDEGTIKIIVKIKYLLKEKGMTIKGVKNILNNPISLKLDEASKNNINTNKINKAILINKVKKITSIIKDIKKIRYGKKNSH